MSFLTEKKLVGLEVGSADYFKLQRRLIGERPLLSSCYDYWYQLLLKDSQSVQQSGNPTWLELGSGGSYLQKFIPSLITSDVVAGVADQVIDGRSLPFPDKSLNGLFLTHTLHHIPDVERFFKEADRTLKVNGVIGLIEVCHTPLSRFLFSKFHPEPYDPNAKSWDFSQKDAMMDANQALSWILFFRDRDQFDKKFPNLKIEKVEYLPWLKYLLAGGVTKKNIIPSWLVKPISFIDRLSRPLDSLCSLHWHIRIRKVSE